LGWPTFGQSRKTISALVSIGLMVAVIYLVFFKADVPAIPTLVAAFPIEDLLIVCALLLIGAGLSAWRLKLIANDLGYELTSRDAIAALGVGNVAGSIFFQVVGQLMARSALLARRGMPVAATVTMTVYERAAAAGVSLILAIGGGWYIFGRVTLDMQHGGLVFLEIVAGLVLAIAAGAWLGWGEKALSASPQNFDQGFLTQILRNVAVSILIQVATMGAYICAAHAFAPTVPLLDLGAASAVVMLAASLPISLAGWGVRELSAVFALGVIGVPSQAALMVAVLIGIISLIVVGLFAVASLWKAPHKPVAVQIGTVSRADYGMLLAWSVPLLAVTAAFFQLYIPMGRGELNVDLADPLAILGGSLFVIECITQRRWPSWRLSGFNLHVASMTLMLAVALLIGVSAFGWTPWALTNRFFGWFILLGYATTGALLIYHDQREGLNIILRTFAAVGASIVALDLTLIMLAQFGINFPSEVLSARIAGFAQNRNAFAFQILLALCATLVADFPRRQQAILITTLCFAGLWFAGSRAAFLALPLILAVAYYFHILPLRRVVTSMVLCACIVLTIFLLQIVGSAVSGHLQIVPQLSVNETDDAERMTSLVGGLRLFLEHPIFGAGLGAFMESRLSESATPLVIHSTPLWLLSELGLVGFIIFTVPAIRILFPEIKRAKSGDPAAEILILTLVTLGTVSVFHELLYQRGFWLLFGAAMACMADLTRQEYRGHADAQRIPAGRMAPAAALGPDDNLDLRVAMGFGWEWSTFQQDTYHLPYEHRAKIFDSYFRIFPWHLLPPGGGVGIDVGCGTGRWATLVAPRVAHLHLLDASPEALAVARENLSSAANVSFHAASVAAIPLPSSSLDFAFALGVLHHVPDTQAAMDAIAGKLKPGAPFLVYLYYAFDNRPAWYRALWHLANIGRVVVSRLPHPLRLIVCTTIAALVYWPLARGAGVLSRLGVSLPSLPLAWYADKSFYVMRTDAYDRFGTRLEKRFTRIKIEQMLNRAGFDSVRFSDDAPFWCAVGIKSAAATGD
jgi:ubiquinone/menaquinone biosynthesis C-methylase UbiE